MCGGDRRRAGGERAQVCGRRATGRRADRGAWITCSVPQGRLGGAARLLRLGVGVGGSGWADLRPCVRRRSLHRDLGLQRCTEGRTGEEQEQRRRHR